MSAAATLSLDLVRSAPDDLRVEVLTEYIQARLATALQSAPPPADARFADLGLDSLKAVGLMQDMSTELGETFEQVVFFRYPTITALAGYLSRRIAAGAVTDLVELVESGDTIVPHHTEGDRAPLYVVHAIDGSAFPFVALGNALAAQGIPLYTFQAPGLDGRSAALADVKEMARTYIGDLLRTRAARGKNEPIRLGGYCVGGIVALEMARQLEALGHAPDALVLLDSPAPTEQNRAANRVAPDDHASLLIELAQTLARRFDMELPLEKDFLNTLTPDEQIDLVLEGARMLNLVPPTVTREFTANFVRVIRAHHDAIDGYGPARWEGRVVAIRAGENGMHSDAEWSAFTRTPETVQLPTTHQGIIKTPHVDETARALARLFDGTAA